MLQNILTPELNNSYLKKYHLSNKLMIPMLLPSLILNKYDVNPYVKNTFDFLNVLNIGYHSYVSTSCIITDYVKPKNLSTIARAVSLKSHSLASIGFLYYIYKNK